MTFWQTFLIATIPAIITGIVTYVLGETQRKKSRADMMVIKSAKHFLEHKKFTDRSFKTLKKYIGGWDEDEDGLRRILVSAGAVRVFREEKDNEEWWYLLERAAERIENKKAKQK